MAIYKLNFLSLLKSLLDRWEKQYQNAYSWFNVLNIEFNINSNNYETENL